MHELALCDAMLKMVRDISRKQALAGVRSITVRVGTLSGVIPHFLTDCWVAVTDGTEYDGVPLLVETEAGRARSGDRGVLSPYAAGPRTRGGLFFHSKTPPEADCFRGCRSPKIKIRSPRCRPCAGAAPRRGCCSRR